MITKLLKLEFHRLKFELKRFWKLKFVIETLTFIINYIKIAPSISIVKS